MNWNESWNDARTAEAQYENAKAEMRHWQDYEVYTKFVQIAREINATPKTILDIGCGVGQYARLWLEAGGEWYSGCDTKHAIHHAEKLNAGVLQKTFDTECDLTDPSYDVCMCACSLEYDQYPPGALYNVLTDFAGSMVILHRLRFHKNHGQFVTEPSWGGDRYIWRWNADELDELLAPYIVTKHPWDGGRQWTYVIEK